MNRAEWEVIRGLAKSTAIVIAWITLGILVGAAFFGRVQTSAQEAEPPSRSDRLLRAEERQATALEGIERELRSLRTDMRRAR